MRYLILSDIHANWEALDAVLAHARGNYDQVLCCGDLVGYGADPNPVVEWVRVNAAGIVRGNHDKACAGLEDLEWFNAVARISAEWTLKTLSAENAAYLRRLRKGPLVFNGFDLVHGSPLDEDEYLVTLNDIVQLRPYLESHLIFFGHTHLQGGFLVHRNGIRKIEKTRIRFDDKTIELEPDPIYLINPGSVGQPRDGDPRAAYAIYTPEERLVCYHRVTYEVAKAQTKILDAGLPDMLAERLATGN